MANLPPTRPSRSTSLSRSQGNSSSPALASHSAAPPVPSGYPPVSSSPSPPRAYPQAARTTETDPLALHHSPNLEHTSTLPPGAAYDFGDPDGAYTAINLSPGGGGGSAAMDDRYYSTSHQREQSLDLVDSYHNGDSNQPRASLSTHNSRTQLRPLQASTTGGSILPTGVEGDLEKHYDSRPIHPGASIQMTGNGQSTRAERQYGSGEKGSPTASGYNSPRGTHSRGQSRSGLGQWSSPGGGNSPYGRLGGGADESGFNSAASSNPNLQFAEGALLKFPFLYLSHSTDQPLIAQVTSFGLQRTGFLVLSSQFTIRLSLFVGLSTSFLFSLFSGSPALSVSLPLPMERFGRYLYSGGPFGSQSSGVDGGELLSSRNLVRKYYIIL